MLKVVGASWHKTRIGTYILAGALLLAIAALFLADMERPNYNGTYCATTYWARNSGYRMEFWGQRNDLDHVPKGVVRACFRDSVLTNGWSQLELESQASYTDSVQAYSAGMMEGALTWHNIYMHWLNTIDSVCSRDPESEEFCEWLRGLITTNVDTVKKMADMKGKHDHYWYQIALFYDQLDGLEIGFRKGVKRSRLDYEIPKQDFLLMNAAVDIRDLKVYYTNFLMEDSGLEPEPAKGMMLLKLLRQSNGLSKVLLGHTSDGSYSSMLRMVKKYTLRYHFSSEVSRVPSLPKVDGKEEEEEDTRVVPGTHIVFTGYPGVLASLDDFYVITGRLKHRLVAAGVKMENDHVSLWRKIDLVRSVSLAPRVMAANRLGYNGRSWSRYFARNPSTGVKQWLLIDMTRFGATNGSDSEHTTPPASLELGEDQSVEENEIPTTLEQELADAEHPRVVTKRMDDYVDDDFKDPQSQPMRMVTIPTDVRTSTLSANGETVAFRPGMFWVIDQLPGRLHAEDVSEKIVTDGYWLTNGVPYFKEVLDIGQVKTNATNSTQSIAKILNNITDLDMLAKFIRQSAYRGDLDKDRPAAFGNIDLKLYGESSDGVRQFRAYSGPLYDQTGGRITGSTTGQAAKRNALERLEQEPSAAGEDEPNKPKTTGGVSVASQPFDWSRILPFEARHHGHPDVWDFEHISPEWAWI
ncbi:AGAP005971-PA-like protein [Anopheles sinensis]|uniref:Phospholipase B-like n=1 Tax=Anopheles sinensis TaxID=74873 RepID=A0A084W0Y4_ANOSI|nr:AGAP005971-PA-like protein [Anopheles sinensis]